MEVYFDNLTAENARIEKLVDDVASLVQDTEQLVQASSANLSEKDKAELATNLARVKSRAEQIRQQAMVGVRATDRVIRKHPYESIGIAFAVGVVVGVLVRPGRCSKSGSNGASETDS